MNKNQAVENPKFFIERLILSSEKLIMKKMHQEILAESLFYIKNKNKNPNINLVYPQGYHTVTTPRASFSTLSTIPVNHKATSHTSSLAKSMKFTLSILVGGNIIADNFHGQLMSTLVLKLC